MAKRCKFCFTKSTDELEQCPICKISYAKTGKEVTKEEKKVWHAARNLYIVSFLLIIGGSIGTCMSVLAFVSHPLAGLTVLAQTLPALILGISLRKFKQWTYIGGIIYYSIVIIINLIQGNLFGLFISGILLYVIANPTSKKILYREI